MWCLEFYKHYWYAVFLVPSSIGISSLGFFFIELVFLVV